MNAKLVTVFLLVLCLAGALNAAAQSYTLQKVQYPGALSTHIYAVNDAGVAVGYAQLANGVSRGFVFDKGTFTEVAPFGGLSSNAFGINQAGVAYGWAQGPDNQQHAFVLKDGVRFSLTPGGFRSSGVVKMNEAGQLIGNAWDGNTSFAFVASPVSSGYQIRILRFAASSSSTAVDINERGQVIGNTNETNGISRAFVYAPGDAAPRDLGTLGGSYAWAQDINERGDITGHSREVSSGNKAFLLLDGHSTMTPIGPSGPASYGERINEQRQVYVRIHDGTDNHAYIYSFTHGTIQPAAPGGYNSSVSVLSDDGKIYGTYAYTYEWRTQYYSCGTFNQSTCSSQYKFYYHRAFSNYNGTPMPLFFSGGSSLVAVHKSGVAAIQGDSVSLFVSTFPGQLTGIPRNGASAISTGGHGINGKSAVVGTLSFPGGIQRAFRYESGQTVDLNTVAGAAGVILNTASIVTDSGHIAGNATFGATGPTGAYVLIRNSDSDSDGWFDADDNCASIPNHDQMDWDHNGIGDACDVNALPNGVIGHDPVRAGIATSFSAAQSADPDGTLIGVEWDFNYDGSQFDAMATGSSPSYTYPAAGAFVVALRLTDNRGGVSLTTQNIVVAEGTPPAITITVPLDGAVYARSQSVIPRFSCSDETLLQSCYASIPAGQLLDTSAAGTFTFDVTAIDAAGNETVKSVTYTVRAGAERQWQVAAPLPAAQYFGNAVTLSDGMVLVAGGHDPSDAATRRAFLYDSKANAWSTLPDMSAARADSAAVTLADGRVLIAGGVTAGGGRTATVDIFDPATRQWIAATPMNLPRNRHTLTLLSNGKVLATGGYLTHGDPYQQYQRSAEVYDPVADTWTAVGNMAERRVGHSASRLPDGRVLIVGGADYAEYKATVEIFNPATNSFSSGPGLAERRYFHSAATLPDGRILIAGGMNFFTQFSDAWTFNPATGQWQTAGAMSKARVYFPMTLMADGRVLAAGGYSGSVTITATDVFNPITDSWQPAAPMTTPRYLASIAPLKDGGVLIAGGSGSTTLTAVETWNGARLIPALTIPRVSVMAGQPAQVSVTSTSVRPVTLTVVDRVYGPIVPNAGMPAMFSNVSTAGLPPGISPVLVATTDPDDLTTAGRGIGELEIVGTPTTLAVPSASSAAGGVMVLTTVLSTVAGPLANQTVAFDLRNDGTDDVTAVTDATGKAAIGLLPSQLAAFGLGFGTYPFKVSFSGSGQYLPSNAAGSLTITDTIPPTVIIASPIGGAVYSRGQAAAIAFTCSDNAGSVTQCHTSTGAGSGGELDTTSPGVFTLKVEARDAAGNGASQSVTYTVAEETSLAPADVWVSHDNKISILDSLTNQIKFEITSVSRPFAVAFSRDGKRAYVSADGTNQVVAFDVATRAEIGRVAVGRRPSYIALSSDDRRVFVTNTNDGTVSVIDAATLSVTGTTTVGPIPYGITVIPESGELFVTLAGEGAIAVLDSSGMQVLSRIAVGNNPQTIALLGSGRRAYVTVQSPGTVIEIDTRAREVVRQLYVVDNAAFIAASADERELYVISASPNGRVRTIDLASWRVVSDHGTGFYPASPARAANANRLFVPGSANGELWIVDTAVRAVVHTLPLGAQTIAATVTPSPITMVLSSPVTALQGGSARVTGQLRGPYGNLPGLPITVSIASRVVSGVTTAAGIDLTVDNLTLPVGEYAVLVEFAGTIHYTSAKNETTLIVADGSRPNIVPVITGTRHASGWYTSDLHVSWQVWDDESPITSTAGCETRNITEDTAGLTLTCEATSAGGTAVLPFTIMKDATPPVISSPLDGVTLERGVTATAAWTCVDALTAPICTASVAADSAIDTSTTGEFDFTVTAVDAVGNRAERVIRYSISPQTNAFVWSQQPSSNPAPSPRFGHGMVYDAERRKTIVIGGRAQDGSFLNDVWEFDAAMQQWAEIIPTSTDRPTPRHSFAIAYDQDQKVVVIFSGRVDGGLTNDSWTWNPATREWRLLPNGYSPWGTGFREPAMAWDPNSRRMILFGGQAHWGQVNHMTYALTASGWITVATTGPEGRALHAMVTDSRRGRIVMHGGWNRNPSGQWWMPDDTWEWDGSRWLRMDAPGDLRPPARVGAAMAYDSGRGVTVMFGGSPDGIFMRFFSADTWEWNGRAWRQRTSFGAPSPRSTSMAYDPTIRQLLLFGGNSSRNDTHAGQLPVGALGDAFVGVAYEIIPLTLDAASTSITVGTAATLTATLQGPVGPASNRIVRFDINNDGAFDGQAITDATGVATLQFPWAQLEAVLGGAPGTFSYSAQHVAESPYGAATGSAALTISRIATVVNAPASTVVFNGAPQALSAVVTDIHGIGIPGAATTIAYEGMTEAPTNAGTYSVLVKYAGDVRHEPSSAVTTLTIERAPSTVVISAGAFDYDGQPHPASSRAIGPAGEELAALVSRYRLVSLPGAETAPATKTTKEDPGTTPTAKEEPAAGSLTEIAPVDAGFYEASASYDGNLNYWPASNAVKLFIHQVTPTVTVDSFTHVYDGQPHPAMGAATGVSGEDLGEVTITYDTGETAPVNAGTYGVTAAYSGSRNYKGTTGAGEVVITKAASRIRLTGGGEFTFDGSNRAVIAESLGVLDQSIGVVEVVYSGGVAAPRDAGRYVASATFDGDHNYEASAASTQVVIARATASVTITGGAFAFDGRAHEATAGMVIGVQGEPLGQPVIRYVPGDTAPVNAGQYMAVASYGGSLNYEPAESSASISIARGGATVAVTGAVARYDGQPHAATGAVLGVDGEDLGALQFTYNGEPAPPTRAGSYAVVATFGGNSNYEAATATTAVEITSAPLTITAVDAAKMYGQPNPQFAAAYGGFVGLEGPQVLAGQLTFETNVSEASGVGTYPLLVSGLQSTDYQITFVPGSIRITPAASVVVLSSSSNPAGYLQPIAVRAEVSLSPAGTAPATGTVDFVLADGTVLGSSSVTNGLAMINAILAPGTHEVTARYSGDANVTGNVAQLSQDVLDNRASSSTSLTVRSNSSTFGESVTMEAHVTGGEDGQPVQFLDGDSVIGEVTLSGGRASHQAVGLTPGTHSLSARYVGTATTPASMSAPVVHNVLDGAVKERTTTRVSPRNAIAGKPIDVDVKVTSSRGVALGFVEIFVDGNRRARVPLSIDGTVMVPTAPLTAGEHKLTVIYEGSDTHLGSGTDIVLRVK